MTDAQPTTTSPLAEMLHFGWVINAPLGLPSLPVDHDRLLAAARHRAAPMTEQALLTHGVAVWVRACARIAECSPRPFLLPLSGGLDSRAVLAGFQACRADVRTVTYGLPGSFDFELAPAVARAAGAPNERIDLSGVYPRRHDLAAIAKTARRPSSLIDMFFNRLISQRYGERFTYINGFMGDALSGKHLPSQLSTDWPTACQRFADWCCASRSTCLTSPAMNPLTALPSEPWVSPDVLGYDDQLDLAVRQQCFVRPIVCADDAAVDPPFLDPEWCEFILGLPTALRRDRRFFERLMRHGFPNLFELPSTARGGLSMDASAGDIATHKRRLKRIHKRRARIARILPWISVPPADRNWQYLDFRAALRNHAGVIELFTDAMAHLDASGCTPWLDASGLLDAHKQGKANHAKALNALLSLDILMDARPELLAVSTV